jgi:hypothetical protein
LNAEANAVAAARIVLSPRRAGWAALIVAGCALPFLVNGYHTSVVSQRLGFLDL